MVVSGLDHVAIPSEKVEELIAFYKRLGFATIDEEAWRAGQTPLFAIQVGRNKINVHPPELWLQGDFTLRGPAALPGCGDFCFVWEGNVTDLTATIELAGAHIEVGPVRREGGRGDGKAVGTSLYTRDPDGNLVEFIVYD